LRPGGGLNLLPTRESEQGSHYEVDKESSASKQLLTTDPALEKASTMLCEQTPLTRRLVHSTRECNRRVPFIKVLVDPNSATVWWFHHTAPVTSLDKAGVGSRDTCRCVPQRMASRGLCNTAQSIFTYRLSMKRPTNRRRTQRPKRPAMPALMAVKPSNKRTIGDIDPPQINNTICVVYRARGSFILVLGSPTPIYPVNIADLLPGSSGAWQQFRVIKVEVWGDDSLPNTTVTLELGTASSSGPGTMLTRYNSTGVSGQKRAHVSVLAGSTFSLNWYSTSDTTSQLCSLGTDYTSGNYVITFDITLELVSVEAPTP
jgi:hypothetical protein